jgi:hypothetical protein
MINANFDKIIEIPGTSILNATVFLYEISIKRNDGLQ